MCGSEEQLYSTRVEGATMSLCSKCSKFGKVLAAIIQHTPEKREPRQQSAPKEEVSLIISPDFAAKIKQSREKLGIRQEEFAKKINEKVSTLHHIETGKFEPSLKLARILELFLNIKLVEEHQEIHIDKEAKPSGSFTIGDFIKLK